MKTSIGIVLIALVTLGPIVQGQTAQRGESRPASSAKVLTRAEIDALLAQPSKVLVIDVRRPDELTSIAASLCI